MIKKIKSPIKIKTLDRNKVEMPIAETHDYIPFFVREWTKDYQNRSLDEPAELVYPPEGIECTTNYIVNFMIPKGSSIPYKQIISNYNDWLRKEVEKECGRGVPIKVVYSDSQGSCHFGKFSDDLLMKVRLRPEVACIFVLGDLKLTDDEFLCWEPCE